ncbi:MAG: hypothetical protein LC798_03605 [Chloroflexi bacterium]|nr:hypothetical protein [Chloroflexota bacterium]
MNSSNARGSGLGQHVATLRRGAWIIALATLALGLLAAYISSRQEPLHQATSDVFVETKNVGSAIADVQSGAEPARVLETQASVARVPDVIRPTLSASPSKSRDPNVFLSRSTVTADPKADVLTFTVTDPDPRSAERLSARYARSYISYRRRLDTGALTRARLEVDSELTSLRRARGPVGLSTSPVYAELSKRSQDLKTREFLLDSIAVLGRSQQAIQVQPHPLRNGILGGILGFMLGIGIVLVRDVLNSRVRTVGDMEEHLGLPLLGRLHEPPKSLRLRNELVMIATPEAPQTEAFQLLATNIEFSNLERGAKSFMIASANPSEGKSTTIANLAVTFARSGKRVVLVDLDLRRPVLHRFFDIEETPGITDVALGRAWLDEALVAVPIGNEPSEEDDDEDADAPLGGALEVLPAGPLPPNPAEFVRSQALSDVLARLESRADLVFVDAPAMLVVSDAINLTPKVDALIVLAKLPTVRTSALKELERILVNAPVAKLGFIVTGAESDETFAGGYGYGYGYGAEPPKASKLPKTPSLP